MRGARVHNLKNVDMEIPLGKLKIGNFSYNTGCLRCPTYDGMGRISIDVQFLLDVTIPCHGCGGKRYGADVERLFWTPKKFGKPYSFPEFMAMTVDDCLEVFAESKKIFRKLLVLRDLGLAAKNRAGVS